MSPFPHLSLPASTVILNFQTYWHTGKFPGDLSNPPRVAVILLPQRGHNCPHGENLVAPASVQLIVQMVYRSRTLRRMLDTTEFLWTVQFSRRSAIGFPFFYFHSIPLLSCYLKNMTNQLQSASLSVLEQGFSFHKELLFRTRYTRVRESIHHIRHFQTTSRFTEVGKAR